jgi:hypothetical protein
MWPRDTIRICFRESDARSRAVDLAVAVARDFAFVLLLLLLLPCFGSAALRGLIRSGGASG